MPPCLAAPSLAHTHHLHHSHPNPSSAAMANSNHPQPTSSVPCAPPDDERERDRQLAEELAALAAERDAIIAGAHVDAEDGMQLLQRIFQERTALARDLRQYSLADANAKALAERKLAWCEFEQAKRNLRKHILNVNADLRKRLDAVRLGVAYLASPTRRAVTKKPKRRPAPTVPVERVSRSLASASRPAFVLSLENQGLARLALPPDDVSKDISKVLRALDTARAGNSAANADHDMSGVAVAATANMPGAEKIHTARGILHFHEEQFEKGDRVSVHAPGKSAAPKYHGYILSINRKEVHLRTRTQTTKIYVAQLRSGKLVMKPDPDGTLAHSK